MTAAELRESLAKARSRGDKLAVITSFVKTSGPFLPAVITRLPQPLMITVAAIALELVPERSTEVIAAVRHPGSKSKTLQRLISLQHRVKNSADLDRAVAKATAKTKYACPKCDARLIRPTLIRHLWFKHKRIFENGQAMEPGPKVEEAIQQSIRTANPKAIDRVYQLAAVYYPGVEPVAVHQAIISRQEREPEDLEPLKINAREHQSGLCWACLGLVPNPVPLLPRPLIVSHGRLAGEGFQVKSDQQRQRQLRSFRYTFPPAVLGLVLTCVLSKPMLVFGITLGIVIGIEYRLRRKPKNLLTDNDSVIDATWRELVPRVGRSAGAVRFLTRLCRSSLDNGDPGARTEAVWGQVEQAAVLSGKGGQHLQWFAAVRVLQSADAGHFGKDWIPSLVGLFAPLFHAEATPVYTEAVAEMLLDSAALSDQDAARLRIALAAAAFAAGLTPADLTLLGAHCPHLDRLLSGNDHWFRLLHAVWRGRVQRRWRSVGDALTVFDFAANPASGRFLAVYPDSLLIHRLDDLPDVDPILIGRRGVTIADKTVNELNSAIEVTPEGTLVFGPHFIKSQERIPRKLPNLLTSWLQYREELLAAAEMPMSITSRGKAILAALVSHCPLCQQPGVVKLGDVSTPWPIRESS